MTTASTPTSPAGPNKILIALIAVGGVLLLAIVAIVFLLIGQNSSPQNAGSVTDPTSSPTPTVTESATPTPVASDEPVSAPADNSLRFTSFNFDPNVACDPSGNGLKAQPQISWTSANATEVWWTPSNQDADSSNGYQIKSSSGDTNAMSQSKNTGGATDERYEFPCNHRQTFDTTVTIYGANGQKVSKRVTFTDINWNTGGDDDDN